LAARSFFNRLSRWDRLGTLLLSLGADLWFDHRMDIFGETQPLQITGIIRHWWGLAGWSVT
jgi:hypothetical protein